MRNVAGCIKCTMLMTLQGRLGMRPNEQIRFLLVLSSDGVLLEDLMGGKDSGLSVVECEVKVDGLKWASSSVSLAWCGFGCGPEEDEVQRQSWGETQIPSEVWIN